MTLLALALTPEMVGFILFTLFIGLLVFILGLVLRTEGVRIIEGLKERLGEGDDRTRKFYSYKDQLMAQAEPVEGSAFRVFIGDDDVVMAYSEMELAQVIESKIMYSPLILWRHMWLPQPGTQIST